MGLKNNLIQGKWKTKIINFGKLRALLKIAAVFLVLPKPVFSNKLGTNVSHGHFLSLKTDSNSLLLLTIKNQQDEITKCRTI